MKNTALHYAAMKGNYEIAKCLTCKGADCHAENDYYETATDVARRYRRDSVFNYLEKLVSRFLIM